MEEDTGKLTHAGGATGRIHGADYSLVDYNRAGIPLIEIVTKPIVGTGALGPQVAKAYVAELRDLMRALGVSDVRMEEGSLRCDVNVSLNRPGDPWGTRSETKNVNSLRSVERAVHSEIERQAACAHVGRTSDPGDPPLPRGHRTIDVGALEGAGGGLPLLPRARPRAGGTHAGVDRGAAGHPAGAAVRQAGPTACRVGDRRPRVPDPGQLRSGGARGGDHRRGCRACRRAQVVDGRVRPHRQRAGHGAGRRAGDAGADPSRRGARRRREPQRQARAPGLRGGHRGGGRRRRRRRRPGPRDRQRRLRPAGGHRRGARCAARRRGEDPRRQGAGRWGDRRQPS